MIKRELSSKKKTNKKRKDFLNDHKLVLFVLNYLNFINFG